MRKLSLSSMDNWHNRLWRATQIYELYLFIGIAICIAAKHGVLGLTKAAALDHTSFNVRINAIYTAMMDRFVGNFAQGRQAVIDRNPSEEWENRKKLPQPFCGFVRMQQHL